MKSRMGDESSLKGTFIDLIYLVNHLLRFEMDAYAMVDLYIFGLYGITKAEYIIIFLKDC